MVDELSSRRRRFQPGAPIRLANDQEWIFPAPTAESEFNVESAGDDYLGLLRTMLEAEDQNERRMSELALAIFLIGLNYELSSSDLGSLFTFRPKSRELADSQRAFELLAHSHLLALAGREKLLQPVPPPGTERRPMGRRFLGWLCKHGLLPKSFFPASRNSEAVS